MRPLFVGGRGAQRALFFRRVCYAYIISCEVPPYYEHDHELTLGHVFIDLGFIRPDLDHLGPRVDVDVFSSMRVER